MPAGKVDATLRQRLGELEGKHGDTVRTEDIEERIDALVAAFGSEIEKVKAEQPEAEAKEEKKDSEEDLLHGPQLAEDAKSQAEVDALLASFD